MTDLAIEVRGLTKSYGQVAAVRGVDLEVETGQVFALLGPNGAGKTTTVEILEGHRKKTGGSVAVLGRDPEHGELALKRRIGIVLQETSVEPYLTVAEAVELFRGYYPAPLPLDDVIAAVGLEADRTTRVRRLSGGQQRRLDVALGLAGDPDLLFLDEPTTGFDPSARRAAWEMIKNLRSLGKTVLLTTHYMDEAQHLADEIAIMVGGRIVAAGPPETLSGRDLASSVIEFILPPGVLLPPGLLSDASVDGTAVKITTATPATKLHELTGWALDTGIDLAGITVGQPSLEDIFIELAAGPDGNDP